MSFHKFCVFYDVSDVVVVTCRLAISYNWAQSLHYFFVAALTALIFISTYLLNIETNQLAWTATT